MDLGGTALGNWKAQQGGCTHIQVRTSIRCNSTRVLRVSQRRIPFPPPCYSSSTRSMTSSELYFFLFVGGPELFFFFCLHIHFSPTHPTTTTTPTPLVDFLLPLSTTEQKIPKGVRIAGMNSPNTTSDKTCLWRCAASPHKNRNAPFPNPNALLSLSHSLVVRYWSRPSVFFLFYPPSPPPLSRGFGPFVNSVPIVVLPQIYTYISLVAPKI